MNFIKCGLVVVSLMGLTSTTAHAQPIGASRLDEAATASAVAIRVDPPDPPPTSESLHTTEDIIREVWAGEPQYTIEKAVRTAKRESGPNLKVDAQNYCCAGIFQIYFSVHRRWLADFGVYKMSDLYDPRINATVALALYHEVGWSAWNGGA